MLLLEIGWWLRLLLLWSKVFARLLNIYGHLRNACALDVSL